jgi:hypothetical protein
MVSPSRQVVNGISSGPWSLTLSHPADCVAFLAGAKIPFNNLRRHFRWGRAFQPGRCALRLFGQAGKPGPTSNSARTLIARIFHSFLAVDPGSVVTIAGCGRQSLDWIWGEGTSLLRVPSFTTDHYGRGRSHRVLENKNYSACHVCSCRVFMKGEDNVFPDKVNAKIP